MFSLLATVCTNSIRSLFSKPACQITTSTENTVQAVEQQESKAKQSERDVVANTRLSSDLVSHISSFLPHYTSDDNPFSESQFKTMKYRPDFPVRFSSLAESEAFGKKFFSWYNNEHYHSGIALLTPQSVHYGQAEAILKKRHTVRMLAYAKNPIRFNNVEQKLKELAAAVYINPPQTIQNNSGQQEIFSAG